jgi:uncharacterized membrane protein SpoIIM required for sporulation
MIKKTTFNSFFFGLFTGILVLLVSFYFALYINKTLIGYTERSVFEYFQFLAENQPGWTLIIPKLLSLSAIPDLLLFFIFIWTDNLKSARGVIGSAFLLGIVILILKFI